MEHRQKTKLSVNVNKLATLRNSRGGNNPDLCKFVPEIESYGADGITIHPRPDQRHIRLDDVYALKKIVRTEFNIEGYPSQAFINLVTEVKPEQVTLVPDPPDALTSNKGWNTVSEADFLKEIIRKLKGHGIRTSIFLDPDPALAIAAAETGCDRIELYTETYATGFSADKESAILPYIKTAEAALSTRLGINAGHDLNLQNLTYFNSMIPGLQEVSIGHALICDALEYGMSNTVRMYLNCLK